MKEQMWCCIQSRPGGDYYMLDTLSNQRWKSIENLMDSAILLTWRKCRRSYGWRCVKVNVTITELNKALNI